MASFQTHITFSTLCGVGFGVVSHRLLAHELETSFLAAVITALGGMMPDLDSDNGKPVREVAGLAAATTPLLIINRLKMLDLTQEGILAVLVGTYVLLRYGVAWIIRSLTVHRGMFHSIPALLISGLFVFHLYESDNQSIRLLLASGMMIGYLSHLILDEIYSVDFNGVRLRANHYSGTALKFFSSSKLGTGTCYLLLGVLLYLTYLDYKKELPAWMHGTAPAPLKFWLR